MKDKFIAETNLLEDKKDVKSLLHLVSPESQLSDEERLYVRLAINRILANNPELTPKN